MNQAATLSLPLLFLAAAPAAQEDRIHWTDGTVTSGVRVRDFTIREIEYTKRGRTETKPSDAVARIECEKVLDAYRRAYGAVDKDERYNQFVRERQERVKRGDLFVAQFGFLEEARMLRDNAEYNQCFATLEKMAEDCPESGFLPELYRMKLDYYLSRGKEAASSATTVARQYRDAAERGAWPRGFLLEANYYQLMAEAVGGSMDGRQLESELRDLLAKTEGTYPSVANRVKLQIAHLLRAQKRGDEARNAYEDLLAQDGLGDGTRAGALLGLGHLQFEAGDPTNREPYKRALLTFLRVYLETPDAPAESRAEALFFAIQACDRWRGPDSAGMARRLRGYLRRDFGETTWAKR